jgi:hypothetical protein
MQDTRVIIKVIDGLVDGWCERRSLKPLRLILSSYPLTTGLTDEWGSLLDALKDIKGLYGQELSAQDNKALTEVISAISRTLDPQG